MKARHREKTTGTVISCWHARRAHPVCIYCVHETWRTRWHVMLFKLCNISQSEWDCHDVGQSQHGYLAISANQTEGHVCSCCSGVLNNHSSSTLWKYYNHALMYIIVIDETVKHSDIENS